MDASSIDGDGATREPARSRTASAGGTDASVTASPVVVIGAGPTGLSAAYHLGEDALLLEQNDRVGGWCRSIEDGGFTFDYAGHIMFSNDPYVHELYEMLLGDNVHWQDREAWIYSKDVYTRYPFQGALYGLPPEVIKECIVGAIEARFGALQGAEPPAQRAPRQRHARLDGRDREAIVNDCCADGMLEARRRSASRPAQRREPRNFEEFIYQVWGAGIAKHFAIPYNRKLWAVPLDEMETSWLGGRVPLPDLEEMIEGALAAGAEADGAERALRLPAARRLPGADGRLPAAPRGRAALERARSRASRPRRRTRHARGRARRCRTSTWSARCRCRCSMRLLGDEAPPDVRARGRGAAPRVGALREPRHRPREPHREALDLLPRGHGLPPHLRAGQRQPALQPAGRLRAHLRDHLLARTSRCRATATR